MTIKELIEELQRFDESAEVRLYIEEVEPMNIIDAVDEKTGKVCVYSSRRGYLDVNLDGLGVVAIKGVE